MAESDPLPLVFHPGARADLHAARLHYFGIDPELESDLGDKIIEASEKIQDNPEGYPFTDDNETRRILVRRFPYKIVYEVLDQVLWVLAVAHQSQKPNYWQARRRDTPPEPA